jgi:hypothetical protein
MGIEGRDFKQEGRGGRGQCFRQGIKGRREERYILARGEQDRQQISLCQ